MRNSKFITIALLSLSLISLELVWTRIFAAEYFYTFAFLVLSVAILGLGLGSLALRLFPIFNRRNSFPWLLIATGFTILIAPTAVMKLGLDFTKIFADWFLLWKLGIAILLLGSAFFLGGMALAFLFKNNHREMPKLYMFDLLGAGVGVLISIIAMNTFGTPAVVYLSALPVFIAAVIESEKKLKLVPAAGAFILLVCSFFAPALLSNNIKERAPVVYSHWDALSKIKIYNFGELVRGINIDNAANTPVYKFDGNFNKPDSLLYEFNINVSYLIDKFDSCCFLSLGAGGGTDVLQALQCGATEVHAVEVNPHINYLLTDGWLGEFSGHIYSDPRVKVVTEDARSYVRRFNKKFDLIYSLSSNSFAALASGSFALSENYLFTEEAFKDYWRALSDSGFVMMEHQFYVPRLVPEVMEALKDLNVPQFKKHFAVYNLPKMKRKILLISKRPIDGELLANAFGHPPKNQRNYIYPVYPAADSLKDNLVNKIVENGWQKTAEESVIDISPCSDNRPFVAQLGMWKNVNFRDLEKVRPFEFFGFPVSKMIVAAILLILVLLILPLNLLPYLRNGEKLKAAPWFYFFAIGMGFMILEVILMQKYSLFIGPSLYSIVTVLLTMLIASGIGSRFAEKFSNKAVFFSIMAWIVLDIFVFNSITGSLAGLGMFGRITVTALLIFPLGFFMGMPFPKGTLKVGELIDWGFAVNGAASVMGSTFIVIIAMSYGFNAALLTGGLLYLAAYKLISLKTAW